MNEINRVTAIESEVRVANNSGGGKEIELPEGVAGWSWGAFFLTWIWAIGNRTWIGLLAFVPYVGLLMSIILGFKGREWAWRNKRWESYEHFQTVQKRWSFWGVLIIGSLFLLGILAAIAFSAYRDYGLRAGGSL